MMKKIILMLYLAPLLLLAQNRGVKFEHNLSWNQIKEKSAQENKFIFVDCFTTWCGPCKYMTDSIFPQPKVGDFFNAKFVNIKIQMDKTDKDNDEVKSWYAEAERFARDYNVSAYPTFLIFDLNGNLVHRIVGAGDPDSLIADGKKALDPNTQYETLLAKFNAEPTIILAKAMALAAANVGDEETETRANTMLLDDLPNDSIFTANNIFMLFAAAKKIDSKAFNLIKDNPVKFEAASQGVKANDFLSHLLIENVINKKKSTGQSVDFVTIESELVHEYPTINFEEASMAFQSYYFGSIKNIPALVDSFNKYIAAYGSSITDTELNNYALFIFKNCDDPVYLKAALKWSKLALEKDKDEPINLDVFANLLYRLGDKEKAIETQEKAILLLRTAYRKKEYLATLEKMKRGEKTWE